MAYSFDGFGSILQKLVSEGNGKWSCQGIGVQDGACCEVVIKMDGMQSAGKFVMGKMRNEQCSKDWR